MNEITKKRHKHYMNINPKYDHESEVAARECQHRLWIITFARVEVSDTKPAATLASAFSTFRRYQCVGYRGDGPFIVCFPRRRYSATLSGCLGQGGGGREGERRGEGEGRDR